MIQDSELRHCLDSARSSDLILVILFVILIIVFVLIVLVVVIISVVGRRSNHVSPNCECDGNNEPYDSPH